MYIPIIQRAIDGGGTLRRRGLQVYACWRIYSGTYYNIIILLCRCVRKRRPVGTTGGVSARTPNHRRANSAGVGVAVVVGGGVIGARGRVRRPSNAHQTLHCTLSPSRRRRRTRHFNNIIILYSSAGYTLFRSIRARVYKYTYTSTHASARKFVNTILLLL